MQLDIRTIYLMYAVLYLMLHGIIWFSLSRYHNRLVRRWSQAGIVSATGIGVLAFEGVLPNWLVAALGQLLMAAGNFGRQYVLRSVDETPAPRWVWGQGLFHLAYLMINGVLFIAGASNAQMMLVFYSFYALTCLDFYFAGRAIGRQRTTAGATTLMFGGLAFSVSLGLKALTLPLGWGAQDLYEPGWDQVVLFAFQILAISLLNFGFMQILIDQFQEERVQVERKLVLQKALAAEAERQSMDLAQVLREREDLLRQLTLSSKTAGMGALVSGIAHEINQPLTSIVLKSELIDAHLGATDGMQEVRALSGRIRQDSHRAAGMISTLRNLFGLRTQGFAVLDFGELLRDVVNIVAHRARNENIVLTLDVPRSLPMTVDATQMQQVVLNLLNNAIEAIMADRPGRPEIALRARVEAGWLEVTVRDNGPGIEPELQAEVFALFKSPSARHMGVGLWLSLAVVQSHGGNLTFESNPGKGTEFLLRLPVRENAVHG